MFSLGRAGLKLIMEFEGCRLTAYKPVAAEKYWTIGYGHYGADVYQGMTITQAQAESLLTQDCAKYVNAVNKYANLSWMNQNTFDALVSFTYNCGTGNLAKLLDNGNRTKEQVAAKIPAYNKGSGQVLKGLVRRRAAELELFNTPASTEVASDVVEPAQESTGIAINIGQVYTTTVNLNVRASYSTEAKILKTYKKGTRFTAKQVQQVGKDVWIRTPSGWIAAYYNGKFYFK